MNGSPSILFPPAIIPLLDNTTTPMTDITTAVSTLKMVNMSCNRMPAGIEMALIKVKINKQATASNFGRNLGIIASANSTEASES